jgi:hypothetical protein
MAMLKSPLHKKWSRDAVPRALWWSDAGAVASARCRCRCASHPCSMRTGAIAGGALTPHHPAVHRAQACVASHTFSRMEAKEKSARTSDLNDMSYMHRVTLSFQGPGLLGGLTQKTSSYFFGRTLSRKTARSRRFTPFFFSANGHSGAPGTNARKIYLIGKL